MRRDVRTAIGRMKRAINASPSQDFVAEVWTQVIKHHSMLQGMPSREVAEALGLPRGYGPEVAKARKIAPRLVTAGMDVGKL